MAKKSKLKSGGLRPCIRAAGCLLILLFHDGGFIRGSYEMCTRPCREFSLEFHAFVVSSGKQSVYVMSDSPTCIHSFVEYRLVPEHKFPQAMLDGLDVVEWMDRNAKEIFRANLTNGFIVGGYSAGGQLAAVIASEARTKGLQHQISGSFLCVPSFSFVTVCKQNTNISGPQETTVPILI